MDVGAVKHVAGSTRVEDATRWYLKRRNGPNGARFVVPDQASLSERDPADPTTPALEIIEHGAGFTPHLLTQAFGHDRHVDEAEELVSI